jgi:PAS domain S-box-containing protein
MTDFANRHPYSRQSETLLQPCPVGEISQHNPNEIGLHLIEKLFPTWVIVQCNAQQQIQFLSTNSADFFGLTAQEIAGKTYQHFLTHIHPEDLDAYKRVKSKMNEVIRELSEEALPEYRFIFSYRLRRGDNRYIHVHEEKVFLKNNKGKPQAFILLKDISGEKTFSRVCLEWYAYINGQFRRVSLYAPADENLIFTPREIEILELIKQGLSSKEIASRLHVSVNTVRNHRSNLFKKTQVRNIMELMKIVFPDESPD